ncbi:MAG: Hsp20/alpha crystallin family protein [Phycisphaeraceae bacterium]|nr:MAG: Hsp20/alpha crystallin family protein [Phycisphaeraceae bacterium]
MNTMSRVEPRGNPSFFRLFENMLGEPFFTHAPASALIEEGTLPLDISEDESSVIVRASLPGFRKEDVDIEVHDGVLTIKASRTEEHEEHGERFYRKERRTGSLSRRVALPSVVLEHEAKADLSNGVLTLRLPKSPKEQPRKVRIG